jgi:hypothetical protein
MFVALAVVVGLQVVVLVWMNRRQEKRRVTAGKSAKVRDLSMESEYVGTGQVDGGVTGEHAFDLTDGKNDEFVYIY